MFSLISKLFLPISLGAALTSLSPLAATLSGVDPVGTTNPITAEELSTSLHERITALRAEVERYKLNAALPLTRPLALGSKGTDVAMLQELLVSLDYLPSDSATGYFGPTTVSSVKQFQHSFLLPDTGTVDRTTLDKIFDISIEREDLDSTYFPEEAKLLGIATSSEALVNESSAGAATTDASPSSIEPTARKFTINTSNYYFSPSIINAYKGDTITIHLTDSSGMHNFGIDDLGIRTANLTSGKTTDLTFTVSNAGIYTFTSSVSTDVSHNMSGTLIVNQN